MSSGKTDGADVTLATVTDTPSAPKGAIVRDVEEWKARLPLQPIFRFLDYLHKKAGKKASESTVRSTLRGFSLAGVLPPPPPLVVRRYVPNSYSQTWLTQVSTCHGHGVALSVQLPCAVLAALTALALIAVSDPALGHIGSPLTLHPSPGTTALPRCCGVSYTSVIRTYSMRRESSWSPS